VKCMEFLNSNFERSINTKKKFLESAALTKVFCASAEVALTKYQDGGKIYIFGNGGSAADAQHLATEFVSKLSKDREPLPAEALTTNGPLITAIGNDYGFKEIFSRQLKASARANDIALAISTSGNSENIISALKTCREMEIPSILFTGHDGGRAKQLADYCILAPSTHTATIQELHIMLAHTLCEYIESKLF